MGGAGGLSLGEINWSDYNYRMPDRTAELMYFWLYQGRGPAGIPMADTEGQEGFVRRLATIHRASELSIAVVDENKALQKDMEDSPDAPETWRYPNGQRVLGLAGEYVAIPGSYLTEYMLARADWLMEQGWQPDAKTVEAAADATLAQQAKGTNHTGADSLPELRNFLEMGSRWTCPECGKMLPADAVVGDRCPLCSTAYLLNRGPIASNGELYSKVWLATFTALRRMGDLPLASAAGYVNLNSPSAGQAAPAPGGPRMGTASAAWDWSEALVEQMPSFFQQPVAYLSDTQLTALRGSLLQALRASLPVRDAEAAWAHLIHVELELRDRSGAQGVDKSWQEVFSVWENTPGLTRPYSHQVLKAARRAVRAEIEGIRAIALADTLLQSQLRGGGRGLNPEYSVEAGAGDPVTLSIADQIAPLARFLEKRPDSRTAPQARYMLGVLLEISRDDDGGRRLVPAAREQFAALKPQGTPWPWWRWGQQRWQDFERF